MTLFRALIQAIRPGQWPKNLFVFAALLFSRNLLCPTMFFRTFAAFWIFTGIAGAVYVLNDLVDVTQDRRHPVKCHRPIASGRLPVSIAWVWLGLLVVVSETCAFVLDPVCFWIVTGYLVAQIGYSFGLKQVVILDVLIVASGFIFRIVTGAVVINVEISSWLLICTLLLSLFLALGKRRHELVLVETTQATCYRKVLDYYSVHLLDQMIAVVTASTVVAYALYTMADQTIRKFGTTRLVFTLPFVLYGIFRYLYLIHQKKSGGAPERILVSDAPLIIDLILWIISVGIIIYL